MKWLIGLAAAWAVAGAAGAQPLADPEANLVEELVVQAIEPGPAWWRVVDGDTTVYVLGVAEDDVPKDIAWDRRALERRMKGANVLIAGNRVALQGGLRDIPALLRARNSLKSKTPLEATLPEPLRVRFVAAREKAGKPASRYAGWQPLIAGEMLVADVRGAKQAVSVTGTAEKLAKAGKVKVVTPATYQALPFVREALGGLTPAVHRQCLEGALADAEAPPARRRGALQGWARGDTAAAVSEPRSFDKCVLLLGGGPALWTRAVGDQAKAIEAALGAPGHAVAVVSLRPWLAEGGVAAQLKARGVRVLGPGEAE
ncbi:TraB/GumN family protein [Phenylobacterium sp. J367]|uniref:TraB/GumN family protein n=1 Tax=Phenylobacterium sp. J367 TaxID=2898435 RepID=UPI00215123AA|nr:TraB/GumN family protein [Phenylobacterium sp. J367]MCR5877409.1 TraB/GumN family protein [Phenylobacterium sp. J367]